MHSLGIVVYPKKIDNKEEKMRKLRWLILAAVLAVGLTACGDDSSTKEKETKAEVKEEQEKSESEKEEDKKEEEGSPDAKEDDRPKQTITIYIPNAETGEIEAAQTEVTEIDAQVIWEELQKAGLFSEDEKVIGIVEDKENQSMDLDLNHAFGEHLRSVGTTGEEEIITSIVNTYLEVFQCEKILLTEEGEELQSSHKAYDTYMERR